MTARSRTGRRGLLGWFGRTGDGLPRRDKEVVKRVVLTPKDETNAQWENRRDEDLALYYYSDNKAELVFRRADWDMEVETGPSSKFEELIERLGREQAEVAWKVLV